jgi:hypothetical protein
MAHHDQQHRRRPVRSSVPQDRIKDFRGQAARLAHEAGAPFVLVIQHPDGTTDRQPFASRAELDAAYAQISDQHDQYKYVAAFDVASNPNVPIHDSVGIPAAEHIEEPVAPAPGTEPGAEPAPGSVPGEETPGPEEKPKWSVGKIAAIVAAVAAGGGLLYAATRKTKSRSSKVIVATPARARSARVLIPSIPPRP